jgi:DTW domain-containing protein YfiP
MLRASMVEAEQGEISWTPRVVCERCRRPASVCYCAHLTSLETKTRVFVLQHPRERDVPIGTARMAALCLPGAELSVGVRWDDSKVLDRALGDPAQPAILLYPGEGATDVVAHPPVGPVTLIVIDGTWSQAKALVRDNPRLRSLPRYTFTPASPSEYRIRREPKASYVSTVEALVEVLGALEGDRARFQALLAPFRAMVSAQVECAARLHGARTRHKRKEAPGSRVPRLFDERYASIVCVVGEANAWPYRSRERGVVYVDELVHWVALRPATGDVLDVVVAPRNPVAPRTPEHVKLSAEELRRGTTLEALNAKWAAFVRPDDVMCFWGHYGATLFARSGGVLPETRIDLRHVARLHARAKVGTLEEFSDSRALVADAAAASGRAGERAARLAALTQYLRAIVRGE